MNNYTYIDSYNIFNITRNNDVEFDVGVFAESLILNDKIIINANSPKNMLEKLMNFCGQDKLIELIKEDIVSFVYDFIPFSLGELKEADNKICKLGLNNYNRNIEQLFEKSIDLIECNEQGKKKLNRVILDNLKITNFNKIDRKGLNSFIKKNINQNEVIYQILKANKPYHISLEYWRDLEYEIDLVEDSLYLTLPESKDHEIKRIANIFASTFLLPIVKTYISIISAEENNCISLWGNKSTEALLEANYNMSFSKKESKQFQKLIEVENMPNIVEMVKDEQININKIMRIRNKSERLRMFIHDFRNEDEIKMISEYFKEISREEKLLDKGTIKTIRFLVGCIHPGLAALDTFILPVVKSKVTKTVRVKGLFK